MINEVEARPLRIDPNGIIQTWGKQLDSGSLLTSTFGYDSVDQLISVSVPSAPSVLKNYQ
ncbi:MAG TPA: hypothetical protein VNW23_00060 [Opitutaceae bacterium]|jgi:hypothetical protein|nr:hypothetical protein [Opitutaceae bacterium]